MDALVAPGPNLTKQMPGRQSSLPWASAMALRRPPGGSKLDPVAAGMEAVEAQRKLSPGTQKAWVTRAIKQPGGVRQLWGSWLALYRAVSSLCGLPQKPVPQKPWSQAKLPPVHEPAEHQRDKTCIKTGIFGARRPTDSTFGCRFLDYPCRGDTSPLNPLRQARDSKESTAGASGVAKAKGIHGAILVPWCAVRQCGDWQIFDVVYNYPRLRPTPYPVHHHALPKTHKQTTLPHPTCWAGVHRDPHGGMAVAACANCTDRQRCH
jgi:hypothetical protein